MILWVFLKYVKPWVDSKCDENLRRYFHHVNVDMYVITVSIVYCRTHNVSVCLYIAYKACGSASLYIKTLYFFPTVLALSAAATVANIKIRYDAKTAQFAIFGTRVIYVFYSIYLLKEKLTVS